MTSIILSKRSVDGCQMIASFVMFAIVVVVVVAVVS